MSRRIRRTRVVGATCSAALLLLGFAVQATASVSPAQREAHVPGAVPGLPDPLHTLSAFSKPPMVAKPLTRWWWSATPLDQKELVAEVDAIAKAGFGGAEIAFGTATWDTPAQRAGLEAVLKEAKRLGLRMDMTLGASWPVTTPANAPGTGLTELELQYGSVDVAGPAPYAGPVPPPADDPTNNKGATLVAATAGLVADEGSPTVPYPSTPGVAGISTAPAKSVVLARGSLVDLTKSVSGGTLTWTPPAPGHWKVFGLWSRNAQNVANAFYRPAAAATAKYLDRHQLGSKGSALLPGVGRDFFEDSLEFATTLFWAPDLRAQFKNRRGYDITPYLPLLFVSGLDVYPVPQRTPSADFDLPAGLGDRVRHDFYETLQDLYESEHMKPLEDWARSHGMHFRSQVAYGAPLDTTRSARALVTMGGVADDESLNAGDPAATTDPQWRFAFDHFRSIAGGVHQGGGKEINSELGAVFWRDYEIGLPDYKSLMDKEWAAGITRPIIHGFDYQNPGAAWPGANNFGGIVAMSWNHRTMPQWSMFKPLNDYWARGNMVLQAGAPRVDVGVLREGYLTTAATFQGLGTGAFNKQVNGALPGQPFTPGDVPTVDSKLDQLNPDWVPDPLYDGERIERAGYSYEFVDPWALSDRRASGRGSLFPGGPAYRALVVRQRTLSAAAAEALGSAVKRGLAVVVVGAAPEAGTSAISPAAEDRRVRTAMRSILASPRVRRVSTDADVLGALRALHVTPDASWSAAVPVYSQHRTSRASDYFYLWNASSSAHSFTASLASTGAPSVLDLTSGSITALGQYDVVHGRTRIPVTLQPGQTLVIGFDHRHASRLHATSVTGGGSVVATPGGLELRGPAGRHTVVLSDGRRVTVTVRSTPHAVVPASWHLHVAAVGPTGTTPHDLTLSTLQDWRDISEISGESGTGTYRTTFALDKAWRSRGTGALLRLGRVEGAMRVYLNGSTLAANIAPDRAFDVTSLVRPGTNTLTVVVTTTLKNKIVSETKSGHPVGLMSVQPATQPYGLLGPVTLSSYGRAMVVRRSKS